MNARVLVMAKAPEPGRAKTRLCPPCTPEQAAALAEAALTDTLDAAVATPDVDAVLALDGAPGPWLVPGVRVLAQRGEGLGERIANAIADAGAPVVVIGMDTPQVTPTHLRRALDALDRTPAALGLATDGGWWALALRTAEPRAFDGVAMSTPRTGRLQHARLRALGLRVARLPVLRDIDTIADAHAVAAAAPGTRFARLLRAEIREPVP